MFESGYFDRLLYDRIEYASSMAYGRAFFSLYSRMIDYLRISFKQQRYYADEEEDDDTGPTSFLFGTISISLNFSL